MFLKIGSLCDAPVSCQHGVALSVWALALGHAGLYMLEQAGPSCRGSCKVASTMTHILLSSQSDILLQQRANMSSGMKKSADLAFHGMDVTEDGMGKPQCGNQEWSISTGCWRRGNLVCN